MLKKLISPSSSSLNHKYKSKFANEYKGNYIQKGNGMWNGMYKSINLTTRNTWKGKGKESPIKQKMMFGMKNGLKRSWTSKSVCSKSLSLSISRCGTPDIKRNIGMIYEHSSNLEQLVEYLVKKKNFLRKEIEMMRKEIEEYVQYKEGVNQLNNEILKYKKIIMDCENTYVELLSEYNEINKEMELIKRKLK